MRNAKKNKLERRVRPVHKMGSYIGYIGKYPKKFTSVSGSQAIINIDLLSRYQGEV